MHHSRRRPSTVALLLVLGLGAVAPTARAEFPQVKINFIDTSEAPKIKIWASAARRGFRPPGDKDLTGVTIFRVPEKGSAQELFALDDGKITWPKGLSEEDIKKKEATPPELALAADLDKGQAIVVIAPGSQDPEYRDGPLGERARNGAGLFFKKLGKGNLMNVIWATDYVLSYVHTEGRNTSLSKIESEREACDKWERERLRFHGMTPEALLEAEGPPPTGFRKGEAYCGLTKEYEGFPKILNKTAYEGFHPNLFGLQQKLCVPPPPEHARKTTGGPGEDEEGAQRVAAIDVALEMLAKHPDPAMPKVLIIAGDGRDGYINALTDCRRKYELECADVPEIKSVTDPKKRREPLAKCVNSKLADFISTEQRFFIERLPTWLALAKAANIRIYSIVLPTATEHTRERLEVLAWRTGGTAHVATDINQVSDIYEQLIAELSHQMVVTFVDEEATPGSTVSYSVEARGAIGPRKSADKATSEPFNALVPPAIERSTVNTLKSLGEKKLGKAGFMAALAAAGVVLLVLLLALGKKLLGAGQAAGAKGAKAAQGAAKGGSDAAAKAKAKAIEKAKKAKEAQKKAMEKAKKG
jgi:hypothetical protein